MRMRVIKKLGGFPCCHRQWRDQGHCSYLHGYDRWVEIEMDGPRDDRGWVVDFADLKRVRLALEHQFDHTTLIDPDDPFIDHFRTLDSQSVIDLREMDPTMEGMALWVKDMVSEWLSSTYPHVRLVRVTCWENEKNAAQWLRDV